MHVGVRRLDRAAQHRLRPGRPRARSGELLVRGRQRRRRLAQGDHRREREPSGGIHDLRRRGAERDLRDRRARRARVGRVLLRQLGHSRRLPAAGDHPHRGRLRDRFRRPGRRRPHRVDGRRPVLRPQARRSGRPRAPRPARPHPPLGDAGHAGHRVRRGDPRRRRHHHLPGRLVLQRSGRRRRLGGADEWDRLPGPHRHAQPHPLRRLRRDRLGAVEGLHEPQPVAERGALRRDGRRQAVPQRRGRLAGLDRLRDGEVRRGEGPHRRHHLGRRRRESGQPRVLRVAGAHHRPERERPRIRSRASRHAVPQHRVGRRGLPEPPGRDDRRVPDPRGGRSGRERARRVCQARHGDHGGRMPVLAEDDHRPRDRAGRARALDHGGEPHEPGVVASLERLPLRGRRRPDPDRERPAGPLQGHQRGARSRLVDRRQPGPARGAALRRSGRQRRLGRRAHARARWNWSWSGAWPSTAT